MFRDSPQPRGEASYSPPPGDGAIVVNSDEMRVLLQHKREVEESLAQIEHQIYQEEGAYIRETPYGNVIRGFDSFHDSKLNTEPPKKSRVEIMEERIFSKSSDIFWQKSRDRAAKEEAKRREHSQAVMLNRGMYIGANANGAAAGVDHVKPISYGAYGSSGHSSHALGAGVQASNHHGSGQTSHKKRHPDGHGHGHKKKKKKRSSTSQSLSTSYSGAGGSPHGGDGNGGGTTDSSMVVKHFDPI